MLVIKQNGDNKLGRTVMYSHENQQKHGDAGCRGPTAEQAGRRSVQMAVLILCAPYSPLSFYSFSETPLPRGCSAPGKEIQKVNSWRGVWNQS